MDDDTNLPHETNLVARRIKVAAFSIALLVAFILAGVLSNLFSDYQHRQKVIALIDRQSVELDRVAISNRSINASLTEVFTQVPRASMARVSVLHNGTDSISNRPIFYADNLYAASLPGYPSGDMQTNVPLSRWSDYLDDLRAGRCAYKDLSTMAGPTSVTRWKELNIVASIICPLQDSQGHLSGALFIAWHQGIKPPTEEELPIDVERTQAIAKAIATAFELRLGTND